MNFSSDPINTLENLIVKNKTKSKSLYLVVVLAVALVLFLLPVIMVDISSQSRGMLRSKIDNIPLMAVVSGKIDKVFIQNNATVQKGDTLLTISQNNLIAEQQLNDTLYNQNQKLYEDLQKALRHKQNFSTSVMREDFYKYNTQRIELQSKVTQAQITHKRYKTLLDKGVVAKAEYEQYFFEYEAAKNALNSFSKQQLATWENQKNKLKLQLKNYKGNTNKIEAQKSQYALIAPQSGTIENFSGLQAGSFIAASQTFCVLSPNDGLLVECTVLPSDIGLLHKNQPVKFQLDAFNYNQWGMLEGKVIDIDKNISIQDNQTFFKVRCMLNSNKLKLKNGYETRVSKGMTVTARYFITKRSLYDLLFDKVDDWLNPTQFKE